MQFFFWCRRRLLNPVKQNKKKGYSSFSFIQKSLFILNISALNPPGGYIFGNRNISQHQPDKAHISNFSLSLFLDTLSLKASDEKADTTLMFVG